LGDTYYKANLPVLEDQLMKAGVRLARVLNEAFDHKLPPDSATTQPQPRGQGTADQKGRPARDAAAISRNVYAWLQDRRSSPAFWLVTTLGGLITTYALGVMALLLLAWKNGSTIFSKTWLRS